MKSVHIYISGFVQGVGYRYFVKSNARKLGINGWVRNLPDGRVEAVLQGNEVVIKKMIGLCRKGPFLSEVKDIQTEWEETEEKFDNFEVKH